MLDELQYWDGWQRNLSTVFCTADKDQAEWVQIFAHISGKSANISQHVQSKDSWSDTSMYTVNIKPRNYAQSQRHNWQKILYNGPVFCVTVPSSYFLTRQNGFISVTGNTNLQNIERMPDE